MRAVLRKINANGQTIVHITHDYTEAVSLGTHIAVMEDGGIAQRGELLPGNDKPLLNRVLRIRHAAHLHPFERPLYELHRAHPARPHRAQGRMETKPWDHDPKLLSRIYDFGPYRNLYF